MTEHLPKDMRTVLYPYGFEYSCPRVEEWIISCLVSNHRDSIHKRDLTRYHGQSSSRCEYSILLDASACESVFSRQLGSGFDNFAHVV